MIEIHIDLNRFNQFADDIGRLPGDVRTAAMLATYRVAKRVVEYAKKRCPIAPVKAGVKRKNTTHIKDTIVADPPIDRGTGAGIECYVGFDDRIVTDQGIPVGQLVADGTKPHPIFPRDPNGWLKFHTEASRFKLPKPKGGGRQRSQVFFDVRHLKGKQRGQKTGRMKLRAGKDTAVYRKMVNHPGTPPNSFMDEASDYADRIMEREIELTIEALLRAHFGSER